MTAAVLIMMRNVTEIPALRGLELQSILDLWEWKKELSLLGQIFRFLLQWTKELKSEVLKGINLNIGKGEAVALIGTNGSGKSTLLKLLMRFWKISKGEIEISGRSIEEINTSNLREMESYMTQETQLFKDTIAGNVRIGRLGATDEEVISACKKASIHDFIMTLPEGYDTQVGELGDTLSGGEKQRIGLARAFLHDAPFMLLDEPTSNLDSLNEAVIIKSLKEYAKEKTVLIVSHRKSTMRIADEIYEMKTGRIS